MNIKFGERDERGMHAGGEKAIVETKQEDEGDKHIEDNEAQHYCHKPSPSPIRR